MSEGTCTRSVTVTNRGGLFTRPCMDVAETVRSFDAEVSIQTADSTVNAAEILGLLSLGATEGTGLLLSARGAQAEEALDALVHLFTVELGNKYTE